MKKTIGLIALVVVIILIGIFIRSQQEPKIDVTWPSGAITTNDVLTYDWGKIDIKGGEVEHTFTFTNDSAEPLAIETASTSCMCTTAYITVPTESVSRRFSLHNNMMNWNGVVPAGEDFTVRVVFDPLAHGPDATGPIHRSIYLQTSASPDGELTTSDPNHSEGSTLEMQVDGDVLTEAGFAAQAMKNADKTPSVVTTEIFDFEETEYDFGVIEQSAGLQTHEFKFTYNGTETSAVTGLPTSCACTTATINSPTLKTGDQGVLTVQFDPNLHEEPAGKFFKTVSILTEPTFEETPEVKIWAEINLDLGPEAYTLQEPHED